MQLDSAFMLFAAENLFPPRYDSDIFETEVNIDYIQEYLKVVYFYRLWFYIIGSLLLGSAYIIHRRGEHQKNS